MPLYISESRSSLIDQWIGESDEALLVTPLSIAETTHAFEASIFRRDITRAEGDAVIAKFEQHLRDRFWSITELPNDVLHDTRALARAHTATIGTRALDTVHVATALRLAVATFWTLDERQAALARTVGLHVRTQ